MDKVLAAAILLMLSIAAGAADPAVAPGMLVRIEYTARVGDRTVDSGQDGEPVSFVVGAGTMMPGLEAALLGMHVGEEKSFEVAPKDAYGEIDPDAVQSVARSALPDGLKPEAGMTLEIRTSGEQAMKAVVKAVDGDRVTLDFNHALAGKTLSFKIRLLSIEAAKASESGYPHAEATGPAYPDLLRITPDGVVFLALDRNTDATGRVADLFGRLRKDTDTALLQCGMQIVSVGVMGEIVKTYGILNSPTRKTLLGLVDRLTGTVTGERVLAGLLAPYSVPEARNRRALTCDLLLAPLAAGHADLDNRLRRDLCPRIERLTACLDDLRVADRLTAEQAKPQSLRLYSGDRWDSARNYLDQFGVRSR